MINMAHKTHDFVAETNGSCFLCSNKIPIQSRLTELTQQSCSMSPPSCPIYSLDCLSRYLKIDMKKVFTGSGPIPPHLVARVEKSRLKTELCEKCVVLTGKFWKLYSQLEKIEMEMSSCLDLIRENLERAVQGRNNYKTPNWNDLTCNLNDASSIAKLEIIDALRKDTLHKCSKKLRAVRPFTKLQRLTTQQVIAEKRKLEPRKVARNNHEPTQYSESNYEDENNDIGSPVSFPNDDGNYLDDQDHSTPSTMLITNPVTQPRIVVQDGIDDNFVSYDMDVDVKMEAQRSQMSSPYEAIELKEKSQTTTSKSTVKNKLDHLSNAIPPPTIVESGVGVVVKPDFSKNPETGKYKCTLCTKEYSLSRNTMNHYRMVHLKVKYKCTMCKKDFCFKQVYETHYLNLHMGVRFKCGKCDKTYNRKGELRLHQKNAHVGK